MSALYMSMSAQETDLEIEDELAKGLCSPESRPRDTKMLTLPVYSAKDPPRPQVQDFVPIEKELRAREGRAISRF